MQRLALDVGLARTGVAIGARIPREFEVLDSDDHLAGKIARIVSEEEVKELIVGMPFLGSGEPGSLSQQINDLIDQIKNLCPDLNINTVDEAYSTRQAEIELKELGLSVVDTKRRVDSFAAMLILEQYNTEHPVQ